VSEDVVLYLKSETAVPLDRLLPALEARGIPVEWRPMLSTESEIVPDWRLGAFVGGVEGARIDASVEPLMEVLRTEALGLARTEAHRELVRGARTMCTLSLPRPSVEGRRLLVNLVDVLLRLGEGVALDAQQEQLFDAQEYRRQHPELPA
jgi:hypothetical protein